jgi:hypothetical protein
MGRKLRFREPTDVVSVRLPLSLIDRLDSLCQSLGIGRAEFMVAILRKYPDLPKPERARIWLANLAWLLVGGGLALLAASHGASTEFADWLAPSRSLIREPLQFEMGVPGSEGGSITPPRLPPRDIRLDSAWRPGNLQGLIPRRPFEQPQGPQERQTESGEREMPSETGREP